MRRTDAVVPAKRGDCMHPRSNVVVLAAACGIACLVALPAHAATEDCIQCIRELLVEVRGQTAVGETGLLLSSRGAPNRRSGKVVIHLFVP